MQDGLLSFMITEKNQEIKWRGASEDEFEYIKEKYARPTAAITVGIAFSLILMIATVRNKSVRMRSRGKTSVTIQFVTTTGVQLCARSNGLKPLAEKGKSALILYFGKNEKNNWKYVVKE